MGPIVNVEIEGLKNHMRMMLSNHTIEADSHVKAALDKVLSEEHIELLIERAVRDAVEEAIREEMRFAFCTPGGPGRRFVKDFAFEVVNAAKERLQILNNSKFPVQETNTK